MVESCSIELHSEFVIYIFCVSFDFLLETIELSFDKSSFFESLSSNLPLVSSSTALVSAFSSDTDDVEDMIDDYSDRLADEEEYKDLSDDEYDKAVEKYVDENIEHYKAIVVSVY